MLPLFVRIRTMAEIGGQFRLTPQIAIRHLINDTSGVDRLSADNMLFG
jgi:hypothetical protein